MVTGNIRQMKNSSELLQILIQKGRVPGIGENLHVELRLSLWFRARLFVEL